MTTRNLCRLCWHVTSLDHCPVCGATWYARDPRWVAFLTDLTIGEVVVEMERARDRLAAAAAAINWLALAPPVRADVRAALGATDPHDPDAPAGPWLDLDDTTGAVTVGCWVTEHLGAEEGDSWATDMGDAWAMDMRSVPTRSVKR